MTFMLFSTSSYINTEPYRVCIFLDHDSNELSVSTTDDVSLASNINIPSRSVRLNLVSLTDKKQNSSRNNNDTIPETITLDKLINIKLTGSLENHNFDIEKSLDKNVDGHPIDKFARSSSQQDSQYNEVISSESTQVDLKYVDISESFIWTVKQLQLEMNLEDANKLCLILTEHLAKLKHRPRHLLAFVNPQCGKDKGRSVYEEDVLPLFAEANISVNTIYTERSNHARDYIKEESLDAYDGLICVGGDGMFSELCHGLLLKTAQQSKLDMNNPSISLIRPNLRIGVIPAGSTDAVVFGTTGHNDPITSTLQIIVGESLLIDLATVHNEHGFVRFLATMLSYGFFGNIIEQSDNWRLFGPLRYNMAGFFQFIRNTSYHTELTITEARQECSSETHVDNLHQHSSENSEKQGEIVCRRNNEKSAAEDGVNSEKSTLSPEIKCEDHYRTISCLNMPCRCDKSKYGMSPTVHLGDGSFDLILVKRSHRINFLRFLRRTAKDGRRIEDLSDVERYRATKVIIRPIVTRRKVLGNWACDGELFTTNEITIRAHHQALDLFASGIRLDQVKLINKEESKEIGYFSGVTRFVLIVCFLFLFLFLFRSHLLSLLATVW